MDFDLESLSSALELAGDAGTATGKIAKGLDTVKSLFKASEPSANADLKLALSELTMQVANAKLANSDLKLKLSALQDELAQAQSFQSNLERYELWETPSGSVVYRLREQAQGNQPRHYLCPACIEDRRKSILQGHEEWRKCTTCRAEYRFARQSGMSVAPLRRDRSDGLW